MPFNFSEWPPELSEQELAELHRRATTYALSHGLLYLPTGLQPDAPDSAIHAPLSILPSPIPRSLFDAARSLQTVYDVLYARIAMDEEFLDDVMGTVGQVDDFVGQLWTGWKELRDNGHKKQLQLGLFRSDYLLHASGSALSLKQVEFNTISSSFGTLSERVAALHRHLYAATDYFKKSPYLHPGNFPANETTSRLVEGLAASHHTYGVPGSKILFVVQAGERNLFDQQWLESTLVEKHAIRVIRQTFDQLSSEAHVDSISLKLYVSGTEISTVYFRAGYTPTDFPSSQHYTTRFLLEKSTAIKCPSIPLQLAGGKKVQQVLTKPGVLERFLADQYSAEQLSELRASWMGMWGLESAEGLSKAQADFKGLVMKPQREGGGNNVYKDSIPAFLDKLPQVERQAWIAMELIHPPEGTQNYLVRAGQALVKAEVVSELGIFGWALFGGDTEIRTGKDVGWLVRTKGKDSDEGGVATGFSVLDSIVLVDVA